MANNIVRQSNFELLRIISMLMIIGLHYFNGSMGGATAQLGLEDYNFYIAYFLESMFIVSVNCFILITGYFSIKKTSVQINKVVDLLLQMIFYGLLFYFVAIALGWESFSTISMVKAAFPILIGLKWFIKVFIILFLLIPFLNIGLNNMNKRVYQSFLVIMIFLFSVYPSFLSSPPVTDNGYGIITFILLYAIGGYIKKFYNPQRSKVFYFNGYLLCGAITFIFSVAVFMILPGLLSRVWGYNFIFNVFGSVFLFLFFSRLNIKSAKINYLATFVLGVYFIHTDPALNDFIYGTLLRTEKFWHSPWFIVHSIVSIIFVYAISTIMDKGRKWLFDNVGKLIVPFFIRKTPFLFKQIP